MSKGTLGKNKYFEEGSMKPPYKGVGEFNGVKFEIAAWVQENGTTGEKFFSLKFQEPYVKAETVVVEGDSTEVPF
tara:strand:+ start:323 stop:547 length:225 start_codon:yes stop_codon:yes gene_type:complete